MKEILNSIRMKLDIASLCIHELNKFIHVDKKFLLLASMHITILGIVAILIFELYISILYGDSVNTYIRVANSDRLTLVLYIAIPVMAEFALYLYRYSGKKLKKISFYKFIEVLRFACKSHKSIMESFMKERQCYHLFKSKECKKELDRIVAHFTIMSILKMYLNNTSLYKNDSYRKTIDPNHVIGLDTDRAFNEFYSKIFFNKEKIVNKTYRNSMFIRTLDSVSYLMYKKKWFIEYYEPKGFEDIISFILNKWYKEAVNYNCEYIY